MIAYSIRRILHSIPLFLSVLVLMFVLLQLTPGDPIQDLIGAYPVPPAYRATLVAEYHLNQSVPERFVYYVWNMLHGNLGYSYAGHTSVTSLIMGALPNTLLLVAVGTVVSMVFGILLGFLPVFLGGRFVDGIVNVGVVTGFAIPTFWFGQLLILFFAVHLGWFPVSGMDPLFGGATGIGGFFQHIQYLTLPVLALSVPALANITRVQQQSALETLGHDYIVTAELKGLSSGQIIRRHVLRNSLLPVVTVIGYGFGTAMAGTVLIENVFGWPGIGNLLILSINRRDNQVIIGIVMVAAAIIILTNLVTDLIYGALDPRIRARS
jgi:peptide/nickel transport system permease protein